MLPKRLCSDFGLQNDLMNQLAYQGVMAGLKFGIPKLPEGMRYTPAYLKAINRSDGATPPELISRIFSEFVLNLFKQQN